MTHALLLIDIQNDFMPGGGLAVHNGNMVIAPANELIKHFGNGLIIATQDWHPANHKSFASNHPNKKPYDVVDLNGLQQILWPDHCIQGTTGAEFHTDLLPIPYVFCKGEDIEVDSYSGFFDNGKRNQTQLNAFLKDHGIKELTVAGLATDFCVKFTVLDALALGYKVNVNMKACKGVNAITPTDDIAAFRTMAMAGATLVV